MAESLSQKRIAIVGAGVAGLALAFELLDRDEAPEVMLLESADRAGGNVRTERDSGYVMEWGPEGFLDNTPETLDLARRTGLEDRLVRANPEADNRYILRDGALRPVPLKPPRFVFGNLLPPLPRLRVLMEPLIPPKRDGGDESVFDFASRRIGRGAASALVDAMVSGVYAGDARKLSLPAAFPKMRRMEEQYGGLFKAMVARRREAKKTGESVGGPSGPRGVLTSFDGGMETFVDGLVKAVGRERIRLGQSSARVLRDDNRWRVTSGDGFQETFDCVVVATPAPRASTIVSGISSELSSGLMRIPFASIAVVGIGYPTDKIGHSLDGFGFLIPRAEGMNSLGALWTSSTFPGRAPKGHSLIRVMIGGATLPEAIDWSDRELLDCCREEIGEVIGLDGEPSWTRIFRFENGIAQYNIGHLGILEGLNTELAKTPGLFLTGTSYKGIAVNSACEAAPKASEAILEFILHNKSPEDAIF